MQPVSHPTIRTTPSAANDDFQCDDPALGLFAVASGSAGGWVVSRTAIRALRQYIAETDAGIDGSWPCPPLASLSANGNRLRAAVIIASRSVDEAQTSPLELAALLWGNNGKVAVSTIGDLPVYVARTGQLHRLKPNAMPIPTTGTERLMVGLSEMESEPDDRWLICSSRIHAALTESEIASVLLTDPSPAIRLSARVLELAASRDSVGAAAIVVSPAARRPM
jgi:hypothetical protein